MGKRKKAAKKPTSKKNTPLETVFTCLFCNHERSVQVKIDKKAGVGNLECKICGQSFQCGINYLSMPIDVYGEWIDAADAVANEIGGPNPDGQALSEPPSRAKLGGVKQSVASQMGEGTVGYDDD